MMVRGAPLIGVTGAYGAALATAESFSQGWPLEQLEAKWEALARARPTAVNLAWAVAQVRSAALAVPRDRWSAVAFEAARRIAHQDVEACRQIGQHGVEILRQLHAKHPERPLNVLTHCNAGWLACVEWGTATSPLYQAHDAGLPLHVWVDETRPRNQGARLTAWELSQHGVPNTVIVDNAGGLLMQRGEVDVCIVGSDRVAANGDVVNKVGTYLKALAARDSGVPFFVALPTSTLDPQVPNGRSIVIEERDDDEVTAIEGWADGAVRRVRLLPEGARVCNPGFDVTPARLVDGLITERGVAVASSQAIAALLRP